MSVVLRTSLALLVVGILLPACNEIDVSATRGDAGTMAEASSEILGAADPEILRLVHEIDGLLRVPQDTYADGDEVSGAFEELLDAVQRQPHTLQTLQIVQSMGYFLAHSHSLGWNPREEDVRGLREDWQALRAKLLIGS